MEPTVVRTDPNNPQTPFEAEMLKAASHALVHLDEGYQQAMECGLNSSRAKSQGVLIACTQLLGAHVMQHCANQGVAIEHLELEISNIVENLRNHFAEKYPQCLADVLCSMAEQETKQ